VFKILLPELLCRTLSAPIISHPHYGNSIGYLFPNASSLRLQLSPIKPCTTNSLLTSPTYYNTTGQSKTFDPLTKICLSFQTSNLPLDVVLSPSLLQQYGIRCPPLFALLHLLTFSYLALKLICFHRRKLTYL
jgi:hypothetical protein